MALRRPSAAAAILVLFLGALVVGLVLNAALSPSPPPARLAGLPLPHCRSVACPQADQLVVEAAYDQALEVTGLGSDYSVATLVPLAGAEPGPCRSQARREGTRLRAALGPGRWRVVLQSSSGLFGAMVSAHADERPAEAKAAFSSSPGGAVLTVSNDRGKPLPITGTAWTVTSDPPSAAVASGEAAGPVCRGRDAQLAALNPPRPVRLVAEIRIPGHPTLTATISLA